MGNHRAGLIVSAAFLFAVGPLVHCGDASFSGDDDVAAGDGATDGASDAIIADGGISDANTGDSPSIDPCPGAEHWICDNFDRDGSISDFPYWDLPTITLDASLAMTPPGDPAPPSPPNALVSHAASGAAALLNKAGPMAGTGIRCDLDFRIDESTVDYPANLIVLSLNLTAGYYRLVMVAGPTGTGTDGFNDYGTFQDGGPFSTRTDRRDFTRGVWTHLSIEAAVGSLEPKISLNGVSVGYLSSIDLTTLPAVTSVSVQIGTAASNGNGVWATAYDNAYCDIVP